MPVLYRHQKGAPLTADEVDGNFHHLVSRLERLEQKFIQNEFIARVEQEGDQLIIISNLENVLGQVKLPTLKYVLRGHWLPETSYAIQDVVTCKAQTWVCEHAHTSRAEFDSDHWNLLLDASEDQQSPTNRQLSVLPSQMPIFLKDTLPMPVLGQAGILVNSDKISFIYSDGVTWHLLKNSQEKIVRNVKDA